MKAYWLVRRDHTGMVEEVAVISIKKTIKRAAYQVMCAFYQVRDNEVVVTATDLRMVSTDDEAHATLLAHGFVLQVADANFVYSDMRVGLSVQAVMKIVSAFTGIPYVGYVDRPYISFRSFSTITSPIVDGTYQFTELDHVLAVLRWVYK